jgi:hypothetical protein
MINRILSLLLIGYASAYAPGIFEQVVHVRQQGRTAYNLGVVKSSIDGYIAVEDCSLIGKEVLACFSDECERLLIADCAGTADGGKAWMESHNIVGEVDYNTFMKYKVAGQALEMRLYLIENWRNKYEYR